MLNTSMLMKIQHLLRFRPITLLLAFLGIFQLSAYGQSPANTSLLWEITGKGLRTPSYVFGTMHVSKKLAFNLSDSFYLAIQRVQQVALEINPETWQDQLVALNNMRTAISGYVTSQGNDYLNENSFRLNDFREDLKALLQNQAPVMNMLLYRSNQTKDDYEEDTFLDLYIYQIARKLGKQATGLESLIGSEKLLLEANIAAATDKKNRSYASEGTNATRLAEEMENAYRRGDLEALDSIDRLMIPGNAFRDVFIIRRNHIQANAMDSLMQSGSLFAGVGASHLPGKEGVLALLQQKGYQVRPVMLTGTASIKPNRYEDRVVPQINRVNWSADSLFRVSLPGSMYQMETEYPVLNRWQYADMANGVYYNVTRIPTYAAFRQQSVSRLIDQADSLLFENIPGKIQDKVFFRQTPFDGIEVSSRTRRGDWQRLRFYFTPFEIILFKISGPEKLVQDSIGNRFFQSIGFNLQRMQQSKYNAGASQELFNRQTTPERWECTFIDTTSKQTSLILRTALHQTAFLDEDSINIRLMETSFLGNLENLQVHQRNWVHWKNRLCLESLVQSNNCWYRLRLWQQGSCLLLMANSSADSARLSLAVFDSLTIGQPTPIPWQWQEDTVLQMRIPASPLITLDADYRRLGTDDRLKALNFFTTQDNFRYWPKEQAAVFTHAAEGRWYEVVRQPFPHYFYIRDSALFFRQWLESYEQDNGFVRRGQPQFFQRHGCPAMRFSMGDTGSSRTLEYLMLYDGDAYYTLTATDDTAHTSAYWINPVFEGLTLLHPTDYRIRLRSRTNELLEDLSSADSTRFNRARLSLPYVNIGKEGHGVLQQALKQLSPAQPHYFEIKTKLLSNWAMVSDLNPKELAEATQQQYKLAGDTVMFQYELIRALADQQTKPAYRILRQILVEDPPVFENRYDYNELFNKLADSLPVAATLFPDILHLYGNNDWKMHLAKLLVTCADSGYIKPKQYSRYQEAILLDALTAWKKERIKEEKKRMEEAQQQNTDEPQRVYQDADDQSLLYFVQLLLPFYESQPKVKELVNRMLDSPDPEWQLALISGCLKHNILVPPHLIAQLAASERYAAGLYAVLTSVHQEELFPKERYSQEYMARSLLAASNDFDRMDSIVCLHKQKMVLYGKPGWLYIYKYRIVPDMPWKLAFSGLQPLNEAKVDTKPRLLTLTDVRWKEGKPLIEQITDPLNRQLFPLYPAGRRFFYNENSLLGY
jgi:uncharacterized protein YbaP (TraB family)